MFLNQFFFKNKKKYSFIGKYEKTIKTFTFIYSNCKSENELKNFKLFIILETNTIFTV